MGTSSSPVALAVNGSTLYVGNGNGSVAVYGVTATTTTWMATVSLPSGSVPTALAVDAINGVVYVADSANNRIEYFSASTCNAGTQTGCLGTPAVVTVGNGQVAPDDPVALAVASSGDLYVPMREAEAGSRW